MALADEVRKLQELRDEGSLSDAEFALAKAVVLANPPSASGSAPPAPRAPDLLGGAAQMWVTFQIVAWIIRLVIGAFLLALFLPAWHRVQERPDRFQKDFDKKWNSFHEPGK